LRDALAAPLASPSRVGSQPLAPTGPPRA